VRHECSNQSIPGAAPVVKVTDTSANPASLSHAVEIPGLGQGTGDAAGMTSRSTWKDSHMPTINVLDSAMYCEDTGSGIPLVFCTAVRPRPICGARCCHELACRAVSWPRT
jgi:hypothetical protein